MRTALQSFYINGCVTKKRYHSLAEAAFAASHLRENHNNAEYVKPYQCAFYSDHWHVGNAPPEIEAYTQNMIEEARKYVFSHPEEFLEKPCNA